MNDKINELFALKSRIKNSGLTQQSLRQYKELVSEKRKNALEQDAVNHINAELVELFESTYLGDSELVHP